MSDINIDLLLSRIEALASAQKLSLNADFIESGA